MKLRKVSSTKGGEYQGPCPECGGVDRFHVWPLQNEGKGSYWCRNCEKAGDNIQFLRDFEGMSFRDACAYLNVSLPDIQAHQRSTAMTRKRPEFTPETHALPADLWQEKAGKLVAWSQENLMKNDVQLAWLAGRGISAQTAENFRLGWNPGEDGKDIYRHRKAWGLPEVLKDDGRPRALWIPIGLVIPHIMDGIVLRIRIRRPEGEPRYYVLPGSSTAVMVIEHTRRAFVVVEAELDAIAVAAGNALAGAVAMGSSHAKPDAEAFAVLQDALQILNALDYDTAGAKAMGWWQEHFDRCDRWPVPKGKDPGEAVKLGIDLKSWIQAGLPPALTLSDVPRWRGQGVVGAADCPRSAEAPRERIMSPEARDGYVFPEARASCPPLEGVGGGIDLPPLVRELYDLLRKNPGVVIHNTPGRFTVLRHGKYVGGRINELVFLVPEVREYILNHPSAEITAENFLQTLKRMES